MHARRLRTVVENLGAELVAHDDVAADVHAHAARRVVDELLGVLQRVQVGAADSARERFDEYFSGARNGIRHIVGDDFQIAHDGGTHRLISVR